VFLYIIPILFARKIP